MSASADPEEVRTALCCQELTEQAAHVANFSDLLSYAIAIGDKVVAGYALQKMKIHVKEALIAWNYLQGSDAEETA